VARRSACSFSVVERLAQLVLPRLEWRVSAAATEMKLSAVERPVPSSTIRLMSGKECRGIAQE
jgi:hypothetical protein